MPVADEPGQENPEERERTRLYVEDLLIFLGVAALFTLTVFFRRTLWGQVGLCLLFVVMLYVFARRLRRVHRAFTRKDEDTW